VLLAFGDGRPVKSLPDMRCADAVCANNGRPNGVVFRFHVSLNKVEPLKRVCNLLSKDDWRATLRNEPVPDWPQVPLVSKPASFSCRAERLARAATCPYGPIVGPLSKSESVRPSADSGKEVALCEAPQIVRSNVIDTSFINFPVGDVARFD
jgi:hypothetical protein